MRDQKLSSPPPPQPSDTAVEAANNTTKICDHAGNTRLVNLNSIMAITNSECALVPCGMPT